MSPNDLRAGLERLKALCDARCPHCDAGMSMSVSPGYHWTGRENPPRCNMAGVEPEIAKTLRNVVPALIEAWNRIQPILDFADTSEMWLCDDAWAMNEPDLDDTREWTSTSELIRDVRAKLAAALEKIQ
jgi:hypothetical protein